MMRDDYLVEVSQRDLHHGGCKGLVRKRRYGILDKRHKDAKAICAFVQLRFQKRDGYETAGADVWSLG